MLTFNDRAKEQLLVFLSLTSANSPDTPLIDTTTITKHLPWLSEVFAQLSNDNDLDFRNLHYFLYHEAYDYDEISAKSLSDFWLFCFHYPTITDEKQKKMIEQAMDFCATQDTFNRKKFDLLLQVILQVSPKENHLALINLLTRLFCSEKHRQFKIVFNKIPEALKQSLFPLLLKTAVAPRDFELIENLKAYQHQFFSHEVSDKVSEQSLSDFWLFCFNHKTMSKEAQKKMIEGLMLGVKKENKSATENFYLLLQSILEMAQKKNNLSLIEPIAMFFCNEEKTFEIDFNKMPEALRKFLFRLLLKFAVDHGNLELVKHFIEDSPALFKDVDQALQKRSDAMLALNHSDRAFFSKSMVPFLTDSGVIDLTSYSSKLIMAARISRKKEYNHTLTFLDKTVEKNLFVIDLSSEVSFLGIDFSNKNAEAQTKALEIINDEKQDLRKKVPAWVKMKVATGECPYFVLRLNNSNEKIEIVSLKNELGYAGDHGMGHTVFYTGDHTAFDEAFEAHKGTFLSTKDFFSQDAKKWQKVIRSRLHIRFSGPLYHEFTDYLDLIKFSFSSFDDATFTPPSIILDEIFVMGGDGTHQIAGEIRLVQTGATMVLIDSLGMYAPSQDLKRSIDIKFHSVLEYAIKAFLERFPEGQVYIETVKRQNTGTGCGLFAALDTQKLHSFRQREGNIFKWLEDQTQAMMADSKKNFQAHTQAIQNIFGSQADQIHMTKLPPEFMLPQQSRALFQDEPLSITARGDNNRSVGKKSLDTPLMLYQRFIQSGSQFSDRFGGASKTNPKMAEKAQNYRAHIVDYLLDRLSKPGGQETIAQELRACSLEGFEKRMRSGQVLNIAGDPVVPAISKSPKSPR